MLSLALTVCLFSLLSCMVVSFYFHVVSSWLSVALDLQPPMFNSSEKERSFLRVSAQTLGFTLNWTNLRDMPIPDVA